MKRVSSKAAVIGVIAGVMVIGWMSLSPLFLPAIGLKVYDSLFHSYLSIVFGTVTIFVVGFLSVYLITNKSDSVSPEYLIITNLFQVIAKYLVLW